MVIRSTKSFNLKSPVVIKTNCIGVKLSTKMEEYESFLNTKMPQRFSTHLAQFSYDEKFETWLDLGSWATIQSRLATMSSDEDEDALVQLNRLTRKDLRLMEWLSLSKDRVIAAKLSPLLPALMIKHALSKGVSKCHVRERVMRDYLKLANDSTQLALTLQQSHFMTCYGPEMAGIIDHHTTPWGDLGSLTSKELLSFLYIHEDLLRVINKHKALMHNTKRDLLSRSDQRIIDTLKLAWFLPSLCADITILYSFMILNWQGCDWLIPIPYFLEIYNKITEMITYLKYNLILSQTIYPKSHYETSVKFIQHLAKQTSKFRVPQKPFATAADRLDDLSRENRGFIYLKMIEGLGVAELIHRGDKGHDWDNTMLSETLWAAVVEERLVANVEWVDSDLNSIFGCMDSAQLASLIGTVKLCGHPSIEIEKGLKKLYDRTHNTIVVDPIVCNRARGVMTRDIVLNFYRTQGRYPKIKQSSLENVPELYGLIRRNTPLLGDEGRAIWTKITTEDWMKVYFDKNGEFDIVENQVMLLKDKALGLTRSKIFQKALLDRAENSSGRSYRRALLAFLLDSSFDRGFRRYMTSYMEDDPWRNAVLDYLVIKLTAKELEEKVEGRMFGASPAYERNRRVVQEGNVMSFMDQFVPEQLLTPNELAVIKKMYSFRYLKQAHPDCQIINISFDFSKWNNNMRHESVDIPAGTVLDDWFNINLYKKTMKAFESMYVYYDDGIISQSWDGQLGGIEGLNQATWTLTFLGGLKDALENLGYKYHITVKGDDVRCAIVIPNRVLNQIPGNSFQQRIESVRDQLMKNLQNLCQSMGWDLNPQESFVSLSLICTSKQYQINNTWLPTDVKKIMKCEALSNVAFPTLEDMISNIFSIAHSTCSQATVIVPSYATACWTAARLLTRTLLNHKGIKKVNTDIITSLLLWPQVIGGPGSLPIQTFFVRGENDMLSVSISLLRHLWLVLEDDPMRKYIGWILSQRFRKNSDFVMLLSDPYSLDLDIPVRPASRIKSALRQRLKTVCEHKDIKALLTVKAEREKEELIRILETLNPYYAKIATAIWECCPYYLIEEVLSKFLNSSSILGFLTKGDYFHQYSRSGRQLLNSVREASKARLDYWITILHGWQLRSDDTFLGVHKDTWGDTSRVCSTQITNEVRCKAWNKDIKGITYPSLIDQVKVYSIQDVNSLRCERNWDTRTVYSQIELSYAHAKFQIDAMSHHFCSTDLANPWLGSETKSSTTLPFQSENIASPSMRKVRRLLTLLSSEPTFGRSFGCVIRKVLEAYTNISPDRINLLKSEEGGGHLAHRTPINSYSMSTMPNYKPNTPQITQIHNEDIDTLKTDRSNRTINFAARHFFLVCVVYLPLQTQALIPKSYPRLVYSAFHHDLSKLNYALCQHCCCPVPDEKVYIDDASDMDLSRFQDIKIIGCSEAEEQSLAEASRSVLYKGVLSALDKMNLNPDNPVAVQHAVQAVIQRLMASSNQTHNNLKFERIDTTPNTQMLDVLTVGMGLKPMIGAKVQMSAIRCCDPRFVFESLLSECFWQALGVAYCKDLLYDITPLGPLIPEMYEGIATVFDQLSKAEMLHEISYVAKHPPPNRSAISLNIIWRHSSEGQGGVAAKNFFSAAWPLFNDWIDRAEYPEYVVNRIIEETTIEGIQNACRSHQKLMIRLTFHIMHLVYLGRDKSTKTALMELGCQIRSIPEFSLTSDVSECVNNWLITTAGNRMICRLGLLLMVGDWLTSTDLSAQVIQQSAAASIPVKLMECNPDIIDEYVIRYLAQLSDLNESQLMCLKYVSRSIGSDLSFSQCLTIRSCILNHLSDQLIDDLSTFDTYTSELQSHVDRVQPLYHRKFHLSCLETDTRIIKERFNQMTEEELGEAFPRLLVRPLEKMNDRTSTVRWNRAKCNEIAHNTLSPGLINPRCCKLSEATDALQTLHDHVSRGKRDLIRRPFRNKCVSSSYNVTRIFMGLNKASSRYYNLLGDAGILDAFRAVPELMGIILGDGGGSVSILIKELCPSSQLVLVSLQIPENSRNQTPDGYLNAPPVELQQPDVTQEVLGSIHWRGLYPGNFNLFEVREQIFGLVRDIKGNGDTVISDADFPDDPHQYMESICSIISTHLDGCNEHNPLIVRIIIKEECPLTAVLTTLYAIYTHCHLRASPLSNPLTQEFWALCSQPIRLGTAKALLEKMKDDPSPHTTAIDMNMSKLLELQHEFQLVVRDMKSQATGETDQLDKWSRCITSTWLSKLPLSPVGQLLELSYFESAWRPKCFGSCISDFYEKIIMSINSELQSLPHIGRSSKQRKIRQDRENNIMGWQNGLTRLIDLYIMSLCLDDTEFLMKFNHSQFYSQETIRYVMDNIVDKVPEKYILADDRGHYVLQCNESSIIKVNINKRVNKVVTIAIRLISSRAKLWHRMQQASQDLELAAELLSRWSNGLSTCENCHEEVLGGTDWVSGYTVRNVGFKVCKS